MPFPVQNSKGTDKDDDGILQGIVPRPSHEQIAVYHGLIVPRPLEEAIPFRFPDLKLYIIPNSE